MPPLNIPSALKPAPKVLPEPWRPPAGPAANDNIENLVRFKPGAMVWKIPALFAQAAVVLFFGLVFATDSKRPPVLAAPTGGMTIPDFFEHFQKMSKLLTRALELQESLRQLREQKASSDVIQLLENDLRDQLEQLSQLRRLDVQNSTVSAAAATSSAEAQPLSHREETELQRYLDVQFDKRGLITWTPREIQREMDLSVIPRRIQLQALRFVVMSGVYGAMFVTKVLCDLRSWATSDLVPAFNEAVKTIPQLPSFHPLFNISQTLNTTTLSSGEKARAYVLLLRGLRSEDHKEWRWRTEALVRYAQDWQHTFPGADNKSAPIFQVLAWGAEATAPALSLIQRLQECGVPVQQIHPLLTNLGLILPRPHLVDALVTMNAIATHIEPPQVMDHVEIWRRIISEHPDQAAHYLRQIRVAVDEMNSQGKFIPGGSEIFETILNFGGYSPSLGSGNNVTLKDLVLGDSFGPDTVIMWSSLEAAVRIAHATRAYWPYDYSFDSPARGRKSLDQMDVLVTNLAELGDFTADIPTSWRAPVSAILPQATTPILHEDEMLDPYGQVAYLLGLLKHPEAPYLFLISNPSVADLRPMIYRVIAQDPMWSREVDRLTAEATPQSLVLLMELISNILDAEGPQDPPLAASTSRPTQEPPDLAMLSGGDQVGVAQVIQIAQQYEPQVVQAWMKLPDPLLAERLWIAAEQTQPYSLKAGRFALRPWLTPAFFQNPAVLAAVRNQFDMSSMPPPGAVASPASPPSSSAVMRRHILEADLQWVSREACKLNFAPPAQGVPIEYHAVKGPLTGLLVRMLPPEITNTVILTNWRESNFIPVIATHARTHHVVQVLLTRAEKWDGAKRLVVAYLGAPALVEQTANMDAWLDITVKRLRQMAEAEGFAGVYVVEGEYSATLGRAIAKREYPKSPGLDYQGLEGAPHRLLTVWEK